MDLGWWVVRVMARHSPIGDVGGDYGDVGEEIYGMVVIYGVEIGQSPKRCACSMVECMQDICLATIKLHVAWQRTRFQSTLVYIHLVLTFT